jgi:hypothetical protein
VEAIFQKLKYNVVVMNGSLDINAHHVPKIKKTMDGMKNALVIKEMDRSKAENYKIIKKWSMRPVYVEDENGDRKISHYITMYPVLFTCNYIKKFKFDDKYVERIEIKPLESYRIHEILKSRTGTDTPRLRELSEDCEGDIRKALNSINFGSLEKGKDIKLWDLLKLIMRSNQEKTYDLLNFHKVGEYGNFSNIKYIVSVLGRNVDDDDDIKILTTASRISHVIDIRMTRLIVSCLSPYRTKYIKFPPKKKESTNEKR